MKITEKVVVPQEITDFYQALNEISSRQIESSVRITLTRPQKDLHIDQKVPLLNFVDCMPDKNAVNLIFGEVCRIIQAYRSQVTAELDKIKAVLDVANKDIRPLLERFIWQDEMFIGDYLAEDSEINAEILSLVLFNVAKTVVKVSAAEIKNQVSYDNWAQNTCPVCGWKASMAVTSMENKQRLLHCSLCDTAWAFKTLACTHCSNEDHNTLKYISVEDDEVYRIDVCDKCRGYIKTVDENKSAVISSPADEDIKTIHLDIIAQQQGYLKTAVIPENMSN